MAAPARNMETLCIATMAHRIAVTVTKFTGQMEALPLSMAIILTTIVGTHGQHMETILTTIMEIHGLHMGIRLMVLTVLSAPVTATRLTASRRKAEGRIIIYLKRIIL